MNLIHSQTQTQIDDELYVLIKLYAKRHSLNLEGFANLIGVEPYSLRKALDRKIKMHIFPTLVEKIESVVKYGQE